MNRITVMESSDSMTGHPIIGDSQKLQMLNNISYYILNLQGDVVHGVLSITGKDLGLSIIKSAILIDATVNGGYFYGWI